MLRISIDSIDKCQTFRFHLERYRISGFSATEAFVYIHAWRNDERRSIFLMKWTATFKSGAFPFDLNGFADHILDRIRIQNSINVALRYSHY